ncbi:hypothetical protein VTN49DRAFT_5183 [Thermomyces lanuginosus]|uniref:uncharacterized protein n=1 Tax=Thermomyces lanuginosus TaxID=5541 RepID=UPI00374374F9
MAAHQLAIAKAAFSASLLRPDPTSVSREEIAEFHSRLEKALSRCNRNNIQSCKDWLLQYVVSSSNRAGGLGKFLVALSESFNGPDGQTSATDSRPSGKRKRLHVLYLLNDVLHHTKYHSERDSSTFVNFSTALQPHIVELLALAASYNDQKNPKHHRRLGQLLDLWADYGYYGAEYVEKLRETVKNRQSTVATKKADGASSGEGEQQKESQRNAPYIMPGTHGDPSTPFYDLPAGNFIPHIIPGSPVPIRPDRVKALQLHAGPADGKLVDAVKKFLKEADRIYDPSSAAADEDVDIDIDELGQTIIRDRKTGEILHADTYYGWSRDFCEQMKKRKREDGHRGRSQSRDEGARKRRRSDSRSSDDRRSRTRSRSRSRRRRHSSSRSPSPTRRRFRSRSESYSPPPPSFPPPHRNSQLPPPPPDFRNQVTSTQNHHNQQQHPWSQHPQQPPMPPPPPPPDGVGVPMPPGAAGFPPPYQSYQNQPGAQMPPNPYGQPPPPWRAPGGFHGNRSGWR